MHGFNYNCNAKRLEAVLDAVTDLFREALLDLEPEGIGFHHSGNLAEAGDLAVGNVSHVGFTYERQHVMLAEGEKLYVLHNYHMVVGLCEKGTFYNGFSALEIALSEELHGLCHALRGFMEAFPLYVFSKETQDSLYVGGYLLCGILVVLFNLSVCHWPVI